MRDRDEEYRKLAELDEEKYQLQKQLINNQFKRELRLGLETAGMFLVLGILIAAVMFIQRFLEGLF